MRIVLYTGKGGVGKTTIAAATAVCAAQRGRRTLAASVDAAHSLGDVLESPLAEQPTRVARNLDALEVNARAEMERHWGSVRDYLVSILRYQGIEEVVADELAMLPGAEELTTLLAVEAHARRRAYDLVVVDCAPTGSALRLLTLPEVARGAFRVLLRIQRALSQVVTPVAKSVLAVPLPEPAVFRDAEQLMFRKLRRLRSLVTDERTSVRLVVTPERMVIDEAQRAHLDLALFELPCDAVVMNRLLPDAAVGEAFFRDWGRVQAARVAEVEALFAPIPVLASPLRDDEVTGFDALAKHGGQLFARDEPDALLCRAPRVRFVRDAGTYRAHVPLPHAVLEDLEVAKLDDEIVIQTAGRRRALKLPRQLAPLALASARLDGGSLVLRFAREAGGA